MIEKGGLVVNCCLGRREQEEKKSERCRVYALCYEERPEWIYIDNPDQLRCGVHSAEKEVEGSKGTSDHNNSARPWDISEFKSRYAH